MSGAPDRHDRCRHSRGGWRPGPGTWWTSAFGPGWRHRTRVSICWTRQPPRVNGRSEIMRTTITPTAPIRTYRHDLGERPFIVIWEMTQACPLACVHCRAEAQPDRDSGELTTGEARDLMAQITEFGSPPPLFVLTGGDPFQRPDLLDLVRYGTGLGLPVAVSPSGTPTLTADRLVELREAGARAISLSLDGSTAQIH